MQSIHGLGAKSGSCRFNRQPWPKRVLVGDTRAESIPYLKLGIGRIRLSQRLKFGVEDNENLQGEDQASRSPVGI